MTKLALWVNVITWGFLFGIALVVFLVSWIGEQIHEWWESVTNLNFFGEGDTWGSGAMYKDQAHRRPCIESAYPLASAFKNADITAKMERLICEIVKYRYCTEILRIPPLTLSQYYHLMDTLRTLEQDYPLLVKTHSPTRYLGYSDRMAEAAYRHRSWKADWLAIKDTLSLLADSHVRSEK